MSRDNYSEDINLAGMEFDYADISMELDLEELAVTMILRGYEKGESSW